MPNYKNIDAIGYGIDLGGGGGVEIGGWVEVKVLGFLSRQWYHILIPEMQTALYPAWQAQWSLGLAKNKDCPSCHFPGL